MQKSLGTIFLLLFLCLFLSVILVFYSYSDFRNSLQLHSSTVLDSDTVMVPNIGKMKGKILLQGDHAESHDNQQEMQEISNDQTFTAFLDKNMDHQIKSRISKRWKQVSQLIMIKENQVAQTSNENVNIFEHRDKRIRSNQQNSIAIVNQTIFTDGNSSAIGISQHSSNSNYFQFAKTAEIRGECSYSFGQALYQRTKQGSTVTYEDSGDNVYTCNYCSACFWFEEAIKQTSTKALPIYTNCCQKGQIKLPQPRPTPNFLERLLDPLNGLESKLFRENIRVYNSMFSFTSMGAKVDHGINVGSGPYVFKISGQVHHLMGSVLPPDGECPKYAQLYVYDTKNEVSNRINAINRSHDNQKIKPNIVQGLIEMFDELNELTRTFRIIRDKFEDSSLPSFNMSILGRQPTDSKQYEEPMSEEIGGLIVGDIGEFNSNRDIVIQSNDGHLQRISKIHPKYMSLQYPILFPYGEDGYKLSLSLQLTTTNHDKKRKKMSMRSFITYQIHDRNNEISTLLKGGRLFQQFLVDSYATVEEDRLDYIRKNQNKLRSEKFKDIYNAVSAGIDESRDIGQKIILPSSHTGSPRDMINNYQDAMTICRQFGNPDLFITFTCNVKWPEIIRYFENKSGYKPEDRPDIISRIFKIKLQNMISYIKSGEPFGQVEADNF